MKNQALTLSPLAQELADVRSGKAAPARVWVVNKRADGTVERKQVSPTLYQTGRRLATARATLEETAKVAAVTINQAEPEALTARRSLGVSQDRFAQILGIRPGTLRNWEQGRRQPTGPAKLLVRLLHHYPEKLLALVEGLKAANADRVETGSGYEFAQPFDPSVESGDAKVEDLTRKRPARRSPTPNVLLEASDDLYEYEVVDSGGTSIGNVHSFWADSQSGRLEFFSVKIGGRSGQTHVIPVERLGVDEATRTLRVPYTTDFIKGALSIDADTEISDEQEREIYRYFEAAGRSISTETHHFEESMRKENVEILCSGQPEVQRGKRRS